MENAYYREVLLRRTNDEKLKPVNTAPLIALLYIERVLWWMPLRNARGVCNEPFIQWFTIINTLTNTGPDFESTQFARLGFIHIIQTLPHIQ